MKNVFHLVNHGRDLRGGLQNQLARLWSGAENCNGTVFFFGVTLLTVLLYFLQSGKFCVTLRTAVGTSCEQVWEERKKSYESYIGLIQQKEIEREGDIVAWNGIRAYDMYEPEWVCDTEKRVGPGDVNIGDGPKFVCDPDSLKDENRCLIYSIGSNYDFSFEDGIRKHAPNCEFHTFDGTMNLTTRALPAGLEEKGIHFHNSNVDIVSGTNDKGWVTKTIEDIVSELGHIDRTIQVFKIDCEGCEYNVIPRVIDMVQSEQLSIEQIQVEMHGTDAAKIQAFFQTMRSAGYAVFHKERNHWGCNGYSCVEYAFIRLDVARRIFEHSHCLEVPTESKTKLSCQVQHQNFIFDLNDAPCSRLGYSQGNQDCMLDKIFDSIGATNKFFVEYGFNTPKQCSGSGPNTCKLWKDGWRGLLLDGQNQNATINLHNHYLYGNNIQEILQTYDVPRNLDFLSSDMDSHDFFVLSSILKSYQPRVVTTEYNSNWPLQWTISQIDPSMSEDLWKLSQDNFNFRQCIWGASASALKQLMEKHGYVMVGVTPGLDLFWARKELLDCYTIPEFSYFVPRMNLGKLHHQKQSNMDYMDWLIDTGIWLKTGNIHKAREVARQNITAMIEAGYPTECFASIKLESQKPWWYSVVKKSIELGPIEIKEFPYNISTSNAAGLLELLCYTGSYKVPSQLIDIGLPSESIYFAEKGHLSEAFEARLKGYQSIKAAIEQRNLMNKIDLHHTALSNFTGEMKIFEARDSSSLFKSAVEIGPELEKRTEEGMRESIVSVSTLDAFVQSADAMKIDTQGAEPEIFMGAEKVFTSGKPFPLIMEYCSRLRNFAQLEIGVHILRGLGYQCYARKQFTLSEESNFCGDFYCAKELQEQNCHI